MINKEQISLAEFKAWLVGMVAGKHGELPDLEDWKMIKLMLDKIVPDQVTVTVPQADSNITIQPQWEWKPYTNPWDGSGIWYSDFNQTICSTGDITIQNEASVPEQLQLEGMPDINSILMWGHPHEEMSQEELDRESKELGNALQKFIDDIEDAQEKTAS